MAGVSATPGGDRAVGVVVGLDDALTGVVLHGESLVPHARRALAEAGVEVLADTVPWSVPQDRGLPVVLHDPACPLTPASYIAELIDRAAGSGRVLVGCRPVTDTIKAVAGGRVGATVDRDALVTVTSPVVLPAAVVASVDDWPEVDDLTALVTRLRDRFEVELVEAPSLGRRVEDESAVLLLEAYEEVDRA